MKKLPSEIICCVAFNFLKQISPLQKKRIVDHFQSFQNIFSSRPDDFKEIENIKQKDVQAITHFSAFNRAEFEVKKAQSQNVHLLSILDPKYPTALKDIIDPPCLLYTKGNSDLLNSQSLAIVGARKASFYGLSVTSQFTPKLVKAGLTIVSGGARGIDTEAHKSTLSVQGNTVCVLGCGIDVCYPSENKKIFSEILSKGCLVSEFPLGTAPYKYNFPQRNRIISGLSQGTLVIEASLKSGSLITARFALDQGKEVYAIPGSILSPYYEGTNKLLQDGAFLVQGVNDLLWSLGVDNKKENSYMQKSFEFSKILSEEEREIFNALSDEAQTPDEIEKMTELDIKTIQESLTSMQLNGYIQEVSGKKFIRTEEVIS